MTEKRHFHDVMAKWIVSSTLSDCEEAKLIRLAQLSNALGFEKETAQLLMTLLRYSLYIMFHSCQCFWITLDHLSSLYQSGNDVYAEDCTRSLVPSLPYGESGL